MIFRQLVEPQSLTYTYLVACEETREAALIDPVLDTVNRDLALLDELGLTRQKGSDVIRSIIEGAGDAAKASAQAALGTVRRGE